MFINYFKNFSISLYNINIDNFTQAAGYKHRILKTQLSYEE